MRRVLYEVTGVRLDGELLTGVESVSESFDRDGNALIEVAKADGSKITRRGYHESGEDSVSWSRVGPVELLMRRVAL